MVLQVCWDKTVKTKVSITYKKMYNPSADMQTSTEDLSYVFHKIKNFLLFVLEINDVKI